MRAFWADRGHFDSVFDEQDFLSFADIFFSVSETESQPRMVEEREQGWKLLHDIGVFLLLLDLVYFYVECLSLEEIFDKL